ncbi:MAG: ferritin-like domain-containing protein [Crocinitomicaceae bacterium]
MKKTAIISKEIKTREQLIYALCEAAELENGLTCIYLFTAFSTKSLLDEGIDEIQQDQIRNWKSVILRVAHQEMEHLGLVCNMLNAIGGPQHFNRPNFPQPAEYYQTAVPMELNKFSLKSMAAFMAFEKPEITSSDDFEIEGSQIVPTPIAIHNGHTVQELYEAILSGFNYLDKTTDDLFIGNPDSQVNDDDLGIGFSDKEYDITLNDVTDIKGAREAIERIIEQGEGVILHGNKVLGQNEKLAKRYRIFERELGQFNNRVIDEKNWKKDMASIVKNGGETIKAMVNCGKSLETKGNEKILTDASLLMMVTLEKLVLLSKKAYSKANQTKAEKLREQFTRPAVNNAEGAIIYDITEEKNSHYIQFWRVYQELEKALKEDKSYEPARNCADNPMLNRYPETAHAPNVHIVEHPYTRSVLELFNSGYETMVDMLLIYYSNDGITEDQRTLFMNTAFFPFMTMFIRPVGEVLSMLPIKESKTKQLEVERAGASFEYYINNGWKPKTTPEWTYLAERLQQMQDLAHKLQKVPKELQVYMPEGNFKNAKHQLSVLAGSMKRINENFRLGMDIK